MSEHTPGPWMVTRKTPDYWVAECDPYWVIAPESVPDTEAADARLIAAAPEMLATLEALLDLHIAHHNAPQHAAARAIIAKARGA